jgi:glycosyltransferase involved in cell wall biosynthesis
VVVPSIAIREGVFKSLEITAEHFLDDYKKRARFFIYNSKQLHNLESFSSDAGINVMVINVQAFNATGKDARRIYEELDDFQSRRPIDVISANRVDYFIANSQHTARRIWRCYRRRAQVIYPPVDLERFVFNPHKEDFYLTVSRLVNYKKVSLIVEAFNQLGLPLVVIGDGPGLEGIKLMAKSNIQVLGSQPNAVVEKYMASAKAFVYAACEDFGIALVEAQACGTPVIAFGGGGALETVIDLRQFPEQGTGLLFFPQTVLGLIAAVETFSEIGHRIRLEHCRSQAMKFNPQIFARSFLAFLEESCQNRFNQSSPDKNRFLSP